MKLTGAALFAAGYVIGARAGRDRYVQIVEGVANASQRLEEFSSQRSPGRQDQRSGRAGGGSGSAGTTV